MKLRVRKTPKGVMLCDMDDGNLRWIVEIHEDYASDENVEAIKQCVERMTS